jgi:hypothetical protein
MDVKLLSIDIYLLLLDRGFFSSSVINSLNKLHQTFLMPAVKNRGIRKAIMEHIERRRKCISEYRMHSSSSDSAEASFTLVILPKKGSEKEEETDPATDRYMCSLQTYRKGGYSGTSAGYLKITGRGGG